MNNEQKGIIGWRMTGHITTWMPNMKIKLDDGTWVQITDKAGHHWKPSREGDVCGYGGCELTEEHTIYREEE